ncbi:3',5'-cyclic AMP phosphodiesterase CpdA [Halapricum desulfuricans]|uniref:3',5'-cyclic AMP phosphodiesterase CpdA n=1 Tax=Halapricum desulfuricans TaxID=2841257 RepID=A0A897NGQ8_9EURY|nr:metallophosphoesterase [Halapricum desulfuricans]QSG10635.1 3',5'-cyclic AMP phosphodiesterase CpdA [Halapricum desulfuricans]
MTASGPVLAHLDRPRGPEARVGVVADPHLSTRAEGTSKLFEHTVDHFAAAIEDMRRRDVDAVLSPGDLTKDGEPWNYEAVDDVLADLDVPFLAVPGNHDVPKASDEHETPSVEQFARKYGPGELPFHAEVAGLDVFGVNSAGTAERLTESHDGHVEQSQRDWLAEALENAIDPVVLVHHNFPPVSEQLAAHQAIEPEMAVPPTMREPAPLAETLAAGDTALILTGHYHLPTADHYRGVREIATPTTCSFPQSYLLLGVSPEGTTVRLVPVADETGLEMAHARRSADSTTARGLTAIAAARIASLPLIDDRQTPRLDCSDR